jgi:hypothetical protein
MDNTQQAIDRRSPAEKAGYTRQIDRVAWAALLIWSGIAMLAEVSWGWFFVGLAIIMLGSQLARRQVGASIEPFWVASAAVFLVGGLCKLLAVSWPLTPVLLILLGGALLGKAVLSLSR